MWKLILFKKACISELESKLNIMDTNGYQLDHVLLGVLFFFKKKTSAKHNKYRVHPRFAKMFDFQLDDLEGVFINKCNAIPIKMKWNFGLMYIEIWRYRNDPETGFLQEIDMARNCFTQRITRSQLVLDVYFLLSSVIAMFYEAIKVKHGFYIGFWTICAILLLVLVVYRLYEFQLLKKRYPKA